MYAMYQMLCWHDHDETKTIINLVVHPPHLHLFPEKTIFVISDSGLINLYRFLVLLAYH